MPIHRHWRVAFQALLACLAIGVLFENLVLLRQNKALRAISPMQDVEVGARLGSLAAASLKGAWTPIPLPSRPSAGLLVLAISPGCAICQANKDGFLKLTSSLRRQGAWRVVWVSRDSVEATRAYCENNDVPISDVLADPTHNTYVQLGLQKVPHVIAIRPDGIVDRVWRGRLDRAQMESMGAYFGVSLENQALPSNSFRQ